jgi:hypothetical protein
VAEASEVARGTEVSDGAEPAEVAEAVEGGVRASEPGGHPLDQLTQSALPV